MGQLASFLLLGLTLVLGAQSRTVDPEVLFDAARDGDVLAVKRALAAGVDVNARARYDMTALHFAASRGHVEVVRLLLASGADVKIPDTFYNMRPMDMALSEGHADVALLLLERGSPGASSALMAGIKTNHTALVKAALAAPDLDRQTLARAAVAAEKAHAVITAMVKAAADARPASTRPAVAVDPATLARYAGSYRNDAIGTATVTVRGAQLVVQRTGQPPLTLTAIGEATFAAVEVADLTVTFAGRAGTIERMILTQPNGTVALGRVNEAAAPSSSNPSGAPAAVHGAAGSGAAIASTDRAALLEVAPRTEPRAWPGFRGAFAAGNGDGQGAVATWDVATGANVKWKTEVPGLAVSSPIVSRGRVFVTTAIPASGEHTLKTGLYGDVKPVDDLSEHTWKVYALDHNTGRVLWERSVFSGQPKTKRHTKSSQANSTPAADGSRVVSLFGSIGLLVCHDRDGKELWRTDVGTLDSGWFLDPSFQWGHSSSPVVYGDSVIVQADRQKQSFVAAYDLKTGKERWRTARNDEISTWGTPTIVRAGTRDELVTNGTKIRGYDPVTGALRWTLGPNSEITVGTPVAGEGLVYVTGGYPPVRPIYAVRPGAVGDITLPAGKTSSDAVAWSNDREGTYIPTPIVYRGQLYTLNVNGVLTTYDANTGERIYRARVGGGGSFSASPVAADGRLYISNEDGEVFVVKTGREYVELAKNTMGDVIMATPAISDGLIVVRTLKHVYGIGR